MAMEDIKDIRCFQHCDRKNILCFAVPQFCPICGEDTSRTSLRIPPYLIESPFTDGSFTQCSIVVKPTVGDFLFNFDNRSDLHIGVTNSIGEVFEFDERGVTVGREGWPCCLSVDVRLLNSIDMATWDVKLGQFQAGESWTAERYDEASHNCYDFVYSFLKEYGLLDGYPQLTDKLDLCKELIVPKTTKAGKYISLYRTIYSDGFVIQNA